MDYHFIFVFCLFDLGLSLPSPRHSNNFDYMYNQKTNAYFKLHPESKSRVEAEAVCTSEGAKVMIPSSDQDIVQVGLLMVRHSIEHSVWIGEEVNNVGCHTVTRDAIISAVNCTGKLPFVCKMTAADARYVQDCQANGDVNIRAIECSSQPPFVCKATDAEALYVKDCQAYGYRYYSEIGSCYKVPSYATSWDSALIDCRKENAHLLVLNTEEEAKTIKEFLKTIPPVSNAYNDLYFYAGFKADSPSRVFRTIFGTTLEENGYVGWSENEPNNWSGLEYCGSVVRKSGMNNDIYCDWNFGFICEREVSFPQMTTSTSTPEKNDITMKITISSKTDVTTQASTTNEPRIKIEIEATETNEHMNQITQEVLKLNNHSPKIIPQTLATNNPNNSQENTTQASGTNKPSHEMARHAPESNDSGKESSTQISEAQDPNHQTTTQTPETGATYKIFVTAPIVDP